MSNRGKLSVNDDSSRDQTGPHASLCVSVLLGAEPIQLTIYDTHITFELPFSVRYRSWVQTFEERTDIKGE